MIGVIFRAAEGVQENVLTVGYRYKVVHIDQFQNVALSQNI